MEADNGTDAMEADVSDRIECDGAGPPTVEQLEVVDTADVVGGADVVGTADVVDMADVVRTAEVTEEASERMETSLDPADRSEVEIKLEPESPAASPASLMFESGTAVGPAECNR